MKRIDSPFKVAMVYAVVASVWIVGSDALVARVAREDLRSWMYATTKGLAFVLVTAGLLIILIRRMLVSRLAVAEELRESQARWQFALEGSGDGLWDWDVRTDQVYFSPQWKNMLGFNAAEIGNTIQEWESRVHPDDLASAKTERRRHWQGETKVYTSEHRLRTKDGAYKWVLDRGQVITRSPEGKPLRMIGTQTDIDERKGRQARTRDALSLLEAVLHNAPIGVIAYRADGATIFANELAGRIVGTDLAGLMGQNFRDLASWQEHGLLAKAELAIAQGQEVQHSCDYTSSFGRKFRLQARLVPFQHEQKTYLLAIFVDESEQNQTMESLRLLMSALQAAPVGWVVTDDTGKIEWVNPAFTAMTGYSGAEVIGKNPRLLKSGKHPEVFYAGLWSTIKRGEVWAGEMFNQRKDGGMYHEFMTIAPIRGAGGAITHYVAIKQDITGQKNLEQQLARAQRLESIGMLASGLAHDLNNIFAPILLSIELLKRKYPTADGRKTLDLIESAGQRGAGIVRQVLTFARGLEGDRVQLRPRYLIKELSQILSETFPRQIQVRTKIAPELPAITGDPTQLHQVLMNLAINARDAMPAGGILALEADLVLIDETRAVRNPPLKPGWCVALRVGDSGTGIPPEVLERMFDPFFTTKPQGKGTGLGLSTTYGIVRSHGGAIEVETRLGEGTAFTVLLPAGAKENRSSESRAPQAADIDGAGRRILVVDDEEAIRLITLHCLQRHGFVAEVAIDGAEALKIFRADPPGYAAVITDLMMPGISGQELARQIRLLAPTLPIIASSGYTEGLVDGKTPSDLDALGVRTLLRKPYTEIDLLNALQSELEPDETLPKQKND